MVERAAYVGRSYARYEERGLLQLTHTLRFPEDRITWRAAPGRPVLAHTERLGAPFVCPLPEALS